MKKVNFQVLLPVIILREGDAFVAYTPALDLSTAGDTLEEAQRHFTEAVQLFFEESHTMGTLEEVLLEMGWKRKDAPGQEWVPPVVVDHGSQTVRVPLYH